MQKFVARLTAGGALPINADLPKRRFPNAHDLPHGIRIADLAIMAAVKLPGHQDMCCEAATTTTTTSEDEAKEEDGNGERSSSSSLTNTTTMTSRYRCVDYFEWTALGFLILMSIALLFSR